MSLISTVALDRYNGRFIDKKLSFYCHCFLLHLFVCVCARVCAMSCARGQRAALSYSPLLPCGSWVLYSELGSKLTEPFYQSLLNNVNLLVDC